MILEVADIRIAPGRNADFEAALARGVAEVASRAAGYRGYRLQRGIESPERYLLFIVWETLENHTVDFRQGPLFPEWRAIVGPFFAGPRRSSTSRWRVRRMARRRPGSADDVDAASLAGTPYVSRVSLRRDDVASFDRYPFSLPAIAGLERIELHPKVTFIVGENGSGKSTLLEAIAVGLGFNAEGGSRNFGFGTRPSHSVLHEYLRIAKGLRRPKDGYFLRAESFFNVATEIERLDAEPGGPPIARFYGNKALHEQSHGESFLALLTERFFGHGLYILDEPEAALSPQRQLAALARIHDLVCDDSQFIIATHSPILMAYPDALIYACTETGIEPIAYRDTEHYRVTRDFLADPERMLRVLLDRSEDG